MGSILKNPSSLRPVGCAAFGDNASSCTKEEICVSDFYSAWRDGRASAAAVALHSPFQAQLLQSRLVPQMSGPSPWHSFATVAGPVCSPLRPHMRVGSKTAPERIPAHSSRERNLAPWPFTSHALFGDGTRPCRFNEILLRKMLPSVCRCGHTTVTNIRTFSSKRSFAESHALGADPKPIALISELILSDILTLICPEMRVEQIRTKLRPWPSPCLSSNGFGSHDSGSLAFCGLNVVCRTREPLHRPLHKKSARSVSDLCGPQRK